MNKKAKQFLSMALAITMGVGFLQGCKNNDTPKTTDQSKEAETQQSESVGESDTKLSGDITFWHSFSQGPRMENIAKITDSFLKENPDVKINIETFSWSDFYTKWTTGLSSGTVPDMSSATASQAVEMIDADAIRPMDDVVKKIGRDQFYESALTEMTADGHVYGVPLYSNTEALWYRKDIMEKYNLEIPETWEELYEQCKLITEKENGNVYGSAVPLGTNDMMGTRWLHLYVRSGGETLITEDGKANITSDLAIDGINYWVKMYKEISPEDSINFNVLDQATLYYQGKIAFDFNTGFHIGGVQSNSPDLLQYVDCAPIPRINKGDPAVGCETNNTPFVVWNASKHPEICEAYIEYFYEPERYVDFLLSVPVGMMSAIKGVTDTDKYKNNDIVKKFQHADEVLNQMLPGSTSIGMEYGPRPEAGVLTNSRVIEEMFQDIILNGTDVNTAAKAAEDKLNQLFEAVGE
jgi:multiple sugar transport system substrate-binding protein